MDPELKARLTSRDLWMRLVYMILFAIAYGLAELLMTVVVIFQFVFILLTGSANEPLLRLGQNLTRYIADLIRFQTFNTEHKPFPFDDWPEETPGGERWRGPADGDEPPAKPAEDSEQPPASQPGASREAPAGNDTVLRDSSETSPPRDDPNRNP